MLKPMILGAALVIGLGATVSSVSAQVLTAEKCVAGGFKLVPPQDPLLMQQMAAVGTLAFEGTRDQPDAPRWVGEMDIALRCGWTRNPAAEMNVEMILQLPEDPPHDGGGGMLTEPAGRQGFMGGVLTYKKHTTPYGGVGSEPDLVTYSALWIGAVSGGLLAVALDHVITKDAIAGWIAAVISATVE
jgi:hypothetical protein